MARFSGEGSLADLARAMFRAADRDLLARKQTQKAHLPKE